MLSSTSNPLVRHWSALIKGKKYREQEGRVLVEGKNLIFDLLQQRRTKRLIVKEGCEIPEGLLYDEKVIISEQVSKKLASTQNEEGVFAEMEMPEESSLEEKKWIVVCDRLQDPGNVGTIIRSALGLSWEGVFFIEPCCDLFNDKALRAAKGATFFLPWRKGSWEDLYLLAEANDLPICITSPEGKKLEGKKECAIVVLGNEAAGVSSSIQGFETLSIPLHSQVESLNVGAAAAIMLYTLRGL